MRPSFSIVIIASGAVSMTDRSSAAFSSRSAFLASHGASFDDRMRTRIGSRPRQSAAAACCAGRVRRRPLRETAFRNCEAGDRPVAMRLVSRRQVVQEMSGARSRSVNDACSSCRSPTSKGIAEPAIGIRRSSYRRPIPCTRTASDVNSAHLPLRSGCAWHPIPIHHPNFTLPYRQSPRAVYSGIEGLAGYCRDVRALSLVADQGPLLGNVQVLSHARTQRVVQTGRSISWTTRTSARALSKNSISTPSFDAADIGVAVENGVVTLTGHVRSYAEKLAVERAAQRVRGVHGIAEEIEIRYPADKKTADDQIAQRAISSINWNAQIPEDAVLVKVEKGWVTLTGTVDWHYQRFAAESAVRRLSGVMGVSSNIEVKPQVRPADVKDKILNALKRNAELEADAIRVNVDNDTVTLEGKVKAWSERGIAEHAAWSAPGVRKVEDRLVVGW